MQSATDGYKDWDLSPSKAVDAIIAISGWPTLYSVCSDDYSIPSSGDLSTASGFNRLRKYANFPSIEAAKLKQPWPEAGGFTIGGCTVDLLDKYTDTDVATRGLRELSDLASRTSYIEGNQPAANSYETTLDTTITLSGTTVILADGTNFAEGDVVYISREAILLGTKSGSGPHTYTNCTRGYLLTDAVAHVSGVKVYGYLPNLRRQKLYVFKGYQDLPLTDFIKAWGGVIDSVGKTPGLVTIKANGMLWETYGGRARGTRRGLSSVPGVRTLDASLPPSRNIVRLGQIDDELNDIAITAVWDDDILGGDYEGALSVPLSTPTGLGDGHFAIKSGGAWLGIISPLSLESEGSGVDNMTLVRFGLVKFPGATEVDFGTALSVDLGWSNATFSDAAAPAGDHLHPITLWLNFLLSATGNGANHATYDAFKRGIGLAIPSALVDVDSFTDIKDQRDVPDDLAMFFLFSKATPAKPFFDDELGKPLGLYMATGNDGRIKLVRPKNPVKLYFSRANNTFTLTTSHSATEKTFSLPGGVYTPTECASALQTGISAATGQTFTITQASGVFTIEIASGTFTFSASDAWATIGHTTASGDTSKAGSAVAQFTDTSDSGDYNVITENDVWGVQPLDTLDLRIAEIWYHCNYDWSLEEFRQVHVFTDSEAANLEGEVEPYEIASKGLSRAFSRGYSVRHPFGVRLPPASGCEGTLAEPSSSYGIDASDSFASLFCSHMFDRYRGQPLRLKAKLKWKFNRLEVGDNVKFSYDIDGALADYELGTQKVGRNRDDSADVARIFEVVSVKPVFSDGCIEVELLGHRAGG